MAEYCADSKQLSWDSVSQLKKLNFLNSCRINGFHSTSKKIDDIWKNQKRVILGYDHYGIAQNDELGILWQSARHRWGKINKNPMKLMEFLRESRANMTREFQTPRPFAGP